ncbi:MAG: GPR1/FUN34/YaaH family transporter [Actinomycetota bacterium]
MTSTIDRETLSTLTSDPGDAIDPRPGNPGLVALPLIVAGGFALGVTNTGILTVAAASVPILLSATSVGLLIATIWAAALGQNVNATVYGTFFGFYGSYAVLSLGLTHNWFGIAAAEANDTVALWLASWLVTIGLLTALLLRLPWTYPALLLVVDGALAALLVGNLAASTLATQVGGWLVFVFVGFVVYFYAASLWEETGGRALPLGRPIIG